VTRSTTIKASRFGLDTNILVYAVDLEVSDKSRRAELIVRRAAASGRCVLSLQNIGEFYHVCARKRRAPPQAAAHHAADYAQLFAVTPPSLEDVRLALAEAPRGRFSYWDALLMATLGRVGCTLLLSEDMHNGSSLAGVTVCNPFISDELPDELEQLLS
jgi:predicted nucleic acid-binding protein